MTKESLIGPVVHEARRIWRTQHAPGKLLPEWSKCTTEQRNEVFAVVRDAGDLPASGEARFLATIARECLLALFPEVTTAITPEQLSVPPAEPEQPVLHNRRGRHR